MRRTIWKLPLLIWGLSWTLAQPARSQNVDLPTVLAGKTVPLNLTLKDLNGDWRRLTVNGQADMSSFLRLMMGAGATSDVYYTKGQTLTVGSETYIVAYRAKIKGPDFMSLMRMGPDRVPPMQEKLTPDTPLVLSLLNQRTMGSLIDIKPFDLQDELADNKVAALPDTPAAAANGQAGALDAQAANTASVNNLKQLGLGTMMYAQDHNNILPPLKDAAAFKKAVLPYVKANEMFVYPATGEAYQPNPFLRGKSLGDFAKPGETIILAEANRAPDGSRAVLYLDGHVQRLSGPALDAFEQDMKAQQQRVLQEAK
ncbi:MAG: hypothetical protein JO316_08000 [Abitibacteriaceae bacterium]|nr:hypothetical protein [Abditibacteriaceae bacterium]